MKILDILNAPWAISQNYHQEMSQLYKSHMLGEKIDFKAIESAFIEETSKRDGTQNELNIQNGIAIINVSGPLTPQASFFSFFFGGRSMADIAKQLKLADESSEVKEKLFYMNTPGGTVEGAFELAEQVRESAKIKPIKTYTDGMIASAGYLLAAATEEILISSGTNQVGSIGVISSKTDWTELDKKSGIVTTEYVSGKYKNIGSPDRKRDDFEDKAIQGTVDYLASIFIDNIATDRNLDVEFIDGLEAKLLIGQQAIDAGLVDGVSTFDTIIKPDSSSADFIPSKETLKIEVKKMSEVFTIAQIQADSPDVYNAIFEAGKIEGAAIGIVDERARITAINSATPGLEDVKQDCINSGLDAGQSALKMLKAQEAKQAAVGVALKAEVQPAVELQEVEVVKAMTEPKKEDEVLKTPEQTFEASAELKAEFGDVETYMAFIEADANGQVKMFQWGDK